MDMTISIPEDYSLQHTSPYSDLFLVMWNIILINRGGVYIDDSFRPEYSTINLSWMYKELHVYELTITH